MTRNKAYKIRIYPNNSQTLQIKNTIGGCRFVFNQMLAKRIQVYEQFKDNLEALKSYSYKSEKDLKAEFPFLVKASSRALQQSRINLEAAYRNFFAKRASFPKFKSKKKSAESYREPNVDNCIEVNDKKIKLLKLGWVRLSYVPKDFEGRIKSVTVSKTKTNEYYVSILTEQEAIIKERQSNKVIGLDLGLTDFCVTSEGEFFEPITKTLKKLEKKLRFWQKKLARQVKESFRRKKTRLKLSKVYEKMKRLQNHYFWHLSNKLCRENQAIGLESLSINNLQKNRKLSHSIQLTSWGEFLIKLKQKAAEYGTELHFASQFYASTKTCFNCKTKKEMSLTERIYKCESCGYRQHRDINAALNLRGNIKDSSEYWRGQTPRDIRPVRLRFNLAGSFDEVLTKNQEQFCLHF